MTTLQPTTTSYQDANEKVPSPAQPQPLPHSISGGAVEELPGSMIRYTPLADVSNLPTLFPAPIASLITTIATSTRMTLRITAFLIEAILESSQYSTRMSLGYLRRWLISMISSARRVYLMSNAAIEGDLLALLSGGPTHLLEEMHSKSLNTNSSSTDNFLGTLDKYTNLGIYFIHHTFTMVELFTMSGFFFTSNLINSAHTAAIESVALFDSLFGSNESSRSLSAIITMVKKEIIQDERSKNKSTIATLSGLTKALTAFACLQVATWKRTSQRMKMKVLYDCTIQAEQEDSYTTTTSNNSTIEDPLPLSLAALEDAPPSSSAIAGPGPATMESRMRATSLLTRNPSLEEANKKLWQHVESIDSSSSTSTRPSISRGQSIQTVNDWSMEDLDDLVGESGDEMYDGPPDEDSRKKKRRESTFEITDELTERTVVTHLFESIQHDNEAGRCTSGRRAGLPFKHRRQYSMPEIAVQPLDTEDEGDYPMRSAATSVMTSPRTDSRVSILEPDDAGNEVGGEEDWVEVDNVLAESDRNGAREESVGTASFLDALEHPHHNAERIQLVLKTMTNKLLQRKRTVRHVTRDNIESGSSEHSRRPSTERFRRGHLRDIDWNRTPQPSTSRTPDSPTSTSTSSRFPSTPSKRRHTKHLSADKALARAKGILSFTRKSSQPVTPSSTEVSTPSLTPSPSRSPSKSRLRPAALYVDTSDPPQEGVRAPPPSPHQSMILRRLSQTASPELRMTSSHPSNPSRPSMSVREAVHTSSSRIQAASSHAVPDEGDANSDNLFPHEGLIRNIHRFMRYSSAAYGQNFLRILGLGSSDFMFPSTGKHHANSWAFAQHTNIPIDCLLLSSFTESSAALIQQEAPPLIHYVAVEHSLKAIVLTCRGTLGLSDVLVDLTCEYQSIDVEQGDPDGNYYVHAGMWQSARKLTVKQSTVHETLVEALTKYPTYGLVLAGHSLGGGVAALLGILCSMPSKSFLEQNILSTKPVDHPRISTPFVTNFKSGLPPGRPIHVYAYGPPAVTSIDLSIYAKGLITSVVQDSDIVPTLSLGGVKDFKNIALTLSEEGNIAEEIVGRVIGLNKRKFDWQKSHPHPGQTQTQQGDPEKGSTGSGQRDEMPDDEEVLSDWMVSLIKTMRADMDNEKLYPPGMVYIMEHFDVYVTDDQPKNQGDKKIVHKQAHRVILRQCDSVEERFREPIFAKSMLQNHLPSQYERSTHLLYEGLGQGKL
ncbi:hypothetical protein I302_107760 [Kwoniella bestiolae CBS 10118]|uniref:sn-1-specific diacylglycerol lipase n=1 Tax=Kwoniella bestiolae CBS 10118 TaxID=1296100 RepID=A0A1B9FXL3_9TREE|nr:hypothetical protein I302_06501 [Kwoniella bestiolae CBS 10118]OCF23518.1 hypothetical protein I302_06501 [Kwoniella bestiolae CBS 10118]